jgi:hypothetical protein
MNGFALGALAMGVGFLAWAGLIAGGFACMALADFLEEVLGLKQTLFLIVLLFAAAVCYMTGRAILVAAGVTA